MEEKKEDESIYSWLLRRFQNEEKTNRIEWCKNHDKECQRCYKYPCVKDEGDPVKTTH